ncbi:MAG: PGPGW domain-containing protein [Anaeromyxobacter sp.]
MASELTGRRWTGRRVARLVGGFALLTGGALLLVLPGPGIPLVLGGLALLAPEVEWARRLRSRLSDAWHRARGRFGPGDDPAQP